MKLHVFHAAEGDCLLLETASGHHMLVDGGRIGSFRRETLPTLTALQRDGIPLDLVVVTHVDQDHIAGILELIQLTIDWRIHEFQTEVAGLEVDEPDYDRPPDIRAMWHNSFGAMLDDLAEPVAAAINAAATRLAVPLGSGISTIGGVPADVVRSWAERADELAASIRQGLELRRRVGPDNLGIPLNEGFSDGLVRSGVAAAAMTLGSATVRVLAPSRANLDDLRAEWDKWLRDNQQIAATINAETIAELTSQAFASGFNTFDEFVASQQREAVDFAVFTSAAIAARLTANQHADRAAVTPQNRASITMLVEEGDHSVLLTGDSHQNEIIDGLVEHGLLTREGDDVFHTDVLKVQHHGSEFNLDTSFCERVTADDYVFCGDGSHHNPERSVIKAIIDTRVRMDDRPFTLSFNTGVGRSTLSNGDREKLKESIDYAKRRARTRDQITVRTLADNRRSFVISLS